PEDVARDEVNRIDAFVQTDRGGELAGRADVGSRSVNRNRFQSGGIIRYAGQGDHGFVRNEAIGWVRDGQGRSRGRVVRIVVRHDAQPPRSGRVCEIVYRVGRAE